METAPLSNEDRPDWSTIVADDPDWEWRAGRFVHRGALGRPAAPPMARGLRKLVVSVVYAPQNRSRAVRVALDHVLRDVGAAGGWALNIGAGQTRLGERVLNLDIANHPETDILSNGGPIPLKDGSVRAVITQEVLEHVADYSDLLQEIHRVIAPGGLFYCQVPFQIGYHSGPNDYWRFSRDAMEFMFNNEQWELQEIGQSLGFGSGFYRIAVEYFAVSFSVIHRALYIPAKAAAAFALIPFRWMDGLARFSAESDRIAAGYFCIAKKRIAAGGNPPGEAY